MAVDTSQPNNPAVSQLKASHAYTFPPFPQPPQGVTITPFKEFKERGIQIAPGENDTEVDALGIPTVVLGTPHDTDICKTNTKRKKPPQGPDWALESDNTPRPSGKTEWFDLWQPDLEYKSYNP